MTVLSAGVPGRRHRPPAPGPAVGHRLGLGCRGSSRPRSPSAGPCTRRAGRWRSRSPGAACRWRRRARSRSSTPAGRCRAIACGSGAAPVPMGAGVQRIASLPGPFSVDLMRLSSPAPSPVAVPVSGGHVVDAGHIGQQLGDRRAGRARRPLRGWCWARASTAGWRATCNGRSLGAPRVLDGYGNGWLAPGRLHAGVVPVRAPKRRQQELCDLRASPLPRSCCSCWSGRCAVRPRRPRRARRLLPDVPAHPRPLARAALLALPAAIGSGTCSRSARASDCFAGADVRAVARHGPRRR